MKQIDFTHAGGFPLTQDELDYLQHAYTECINAFALMGGDGTTPVIISGMATSIPTVGTIMVTDGWFFYNGEMIRFSGSSVIPTGSDLPVVVITPATTSLTYNDGSIYPAVLNKTATLMSMPSATDATHFPLASLVPFQLAFGVSGRESNWNSIFVNTLASDGGVTGHIYYKKNLLTNTLQIRASLNANNAQNFSASPLAQFSILGTLPSGYFPAVAAYFTTYYFAGNLFKDDLGVSWVKHLTSVVNPSGDVSINFLRPDVSISAYTVMFNTIIPLD